MRRLLVAWGSTLRGDDGVAWRVAAEVARRDPGVEVVAVHQPTPELVARLAEADRAVLVDAAADLAPGEVAERDPAATAVGIGHELDPAVLLAWARELYGGAPETTLLAIGIADAGWGEELSGAAEAAVPAAAARALQLLAGAGPR